MLNYTKYLKVNDLKEGTDQDAGYDMFLPEINEELVKMFIQVNKLETELQIQAATEKHGDDNIWIVLNNKVNKYDITGEVLAIFNAKTKTINIFDDCIIPSGIGLDLPTGYFAYERNRSSNQGNNIFLVTGTIDSSYTGSIGFQINISNKSQIVLSAETRIAQFILHKLEKPKANYLKIFDFKKLPTVKEKEKTRGSMGFGSTGKH